MSNVFLNKQAYQQVQKVSIKSLTQEINLKMPSRLIVEGTDLHMLGASIQADQTFHSNAGGPQIKDNSTDNGIIN